MNRFSVITPLLGLGFKLNHNRYLGQIKSPWNQISSKGDGDMKRLRVPKNWKPPFTVEKMEKYEDFYVVGDKYWFWTSDYLSKEEADFIALGLNMATKKLCKK
ncbi:MAG: hypothetical protein KGL39_31995 [Patescibacteria group bacterium]|nr:hypothetical protein [Patescibacteria group bacterium]